MKTSDMSDGVLLDINNQCLRKREVKKNSKKSAKSNKRMTVATTSIPTAHERDAMYEEYKSKLNRSTNC